MFKNRTFSRFKRILFVSSAEFLNYFLHIVIVKTLINIAKVKGTTRLKI